jgi:hypothetical protein
MGRSGDDAMPEREAKRPRLEEVDPALSPECEQLVKQILGRNTHMQELVASVRAQVTSMDPRRGIRLIDVDHASIEKVGYADGNQRTFNFRIGFYKEWTSDWYIPTASGSRAKGCLCGVPETETDLEPHVRRLFDDVKPERLLLYLTALKEYSDALAGEWAELAVKVTAHMAAYHAIRERLGLPQEEQFNEQGNESWIVPFSGSHHGIRVKLEDSPDEYGVHDIDTFTRHLVELHKRDADRPPTLFKPQEPDEDDVELVNE